MFNIRNTFKSVQWKWEKYPLLLWLNGKEHRDDVGPSTGLYTWPWSLVRQLQRHITSEVPWRYISSCLCMYIDDIASIITAYDTEDVRRKLWSEHKATGEKKTTYIADYWYSTLWSIYDKVMPTAFLHPFPEKRWIPSIFLL